MWKKRQRYLEHCLYFDFLVWVLLWLKKKIGSKTFWFVLVLNSTFNKGQPFQTPVVLLFTLSFLIIMVVFWYILRIVLIKCVKNHLISHNSFVKPNQMLLLALWWVDVFPYYIFCLSRNWWIVNMLYI
jgi:hypothetical protein